MINETITWKDCASSMPDAEQTVLISTDGANEPTWIGYWDGGLYWYDSEGIPVNVTHWAEMPKGAALAAAPTPKAEPVAWRYAPSAVWFEYLFTTDPEKVATCQRYGLICEPLYAHPAPTPTEQVDARDAARYRWLRDVGNATWIPFKSRTGYCAERADAAIDAAIKELT